jgi:hypothetical protein
MFSGFCVPGYGHRTSWKIVKSTTESTIISHWLTLILIYEKSQLYSLSNKGGRLLGVSCLREPHLPQGKRTVCLIRRKKTDSLPNCMVALSSEGVRGHKGRGNACHVEAGIYGLVRRQAAATGPTPTDAPELARSPTRIVERRSLATGSLEVGPFYHRRPDHADRRSKPLRAHRQCVDFCDRRCWQGCAVRIDGEPDLRRGAIQFAVLDGERFDVIWRAHTRKDYCYPR